MRNVDIAPTILDIAGVPVPDSFEGTSLLSLVLGEEENGHRPSFAGLRSTRART